MIALRSTPHPDRRDFHREVAQATGESVRLVRRRGFVLLDVNVVPTTQDVVLCLDCPGCGRCVQLPADRAADDVPWAECDGCDTAYPYSDEEIYVR